MDCGTAVEPDVHVADEREPVTGSRIAVTQKLLMSGGRSGVGWTTRTGLTVSSASKTRIEGVSLLVCHTSATTPLLSTRGFPLAGVYL